MPAVFAARGTARLAELRGRLRRLEAGRGSVALGLPALDAMGGLPRGCLHEVAGEADDGAATGFCAFLLARLAAGKPVLWCHQDPAPYPHGLRVFGLDPGRVLWLALHRPTDRLKAMEEGLRCRDLAAVVGEVDAVDGIASRRLQLAAEASGVTALLLRQRGTPTTAVTRWRVEATPSPFPLAGGGYRWRVALLHRRGGRPDEWLMEWDDETGDLAVVAALGDRSAAPAA